MGKKGLIVKDIPKIMEDSESTLLSTNLVSLSDGQNSLLAFYQVEFGFDCFYFCRIEKKKGKRKLSKAVLITGCRQWFGFSSGY